MKEHVQEPGVRKYAGDDLIELQSEPLKAIQTLFQEYPPCIVQGCEVEVLAAGTYVVKPGLLSLKGLDAEGVSCHKLVPFEGVSDVVLPAYFTLAYQTQTRVYGDGKAKPIAHKYKATLSVITPAADVEYLQITAIGATRWVDVLGISKKLDREGGQAKDVLVNYATATTRNIPISGAKLGILFGLVTKWFTDLKTLAFKDKIGKIDLDAALKSELDGKVIKEIGKGLSQNNYTTAEKNKLATTADVNHNHAGVYEPKDESLQSSKHTHNNKSVLDNITAAFVSSWNALVSFPGFASSGVSTTGKAVQANDSRLSNARTPVAHNHNYELPFSKNTAFNKNFNTVGSSNMRYTGHPSNGGLGTSNEVARADHRHGLPDIANANQFGFMSAIHAAKLDTLFGVIAAGGVTFNGGIGVVYKGSFSASKEQTGIYWVEIPGFHLAIVNANGSYDALVFNKGPNGFNVRILNSKGVLTDYPFTFAALKF